MKVLFTVNFGKDYFESLKEDGIEPIFIDPKTEKIDMDKIRDIDMMVDFNSYDEIDIDELKNLKAIQLVSVGFNHIPFDKIRKNNVIVSNYKGGFGIPISESVILYILQIYNRSKLFYELQSKKIWEEHRHQGLLYNKTVTIVGTGSIAQETAKKLKAFGTTVYGINTRGDKRNYFDECFTSEDMKELFSKSDIIILLMPDTEKTRGMIGDEELYAMKYNSILINVGRGSTLKLDDLEKHIDKFRGVALDVFEVEPLPKDSYLWDKENVIITPHNTGFSEENNKLLREMARESILKVMKTGKPLNPVNMERGY